MRGAGDRSSVAVSLLRAIGRGDVIDVLGGMSAWNAAGHPMTKEDTVEHGPRVVVGALDPLLMAQLTGLPDVQAVADEAGERIDAALAART